MHATEHPRPDTGFTVSKTRMSLVPQRTRKRDLVWWCRCVSYVHTQVHMSSYLFVQICLHVTYTNNILDYERVTTGFTHASVCSMCASMYKMYTTVSEACSHAWSKMFSCVRPQETQRHHCTKTFWADMVTQRDCSFQHTEKHDGFGREWNFSVCVVGSDYVLHQHILIVNSWPSLYLPSYQPLVTSLRVSIAKVWMNGNKKQTRWHKIGQKTSLFFWKGVKYSNKLSCTCA